MLISNWIQISTAMSKMTGKYLGLVLVQESTNQHGRNYVHCLHLESFGYTSKCQFTINISTSTAR